MLRMNALQNRLVREITTTPHPILSPPAAAAPHKMHALSRIIFGSFQKWDLYAARATIKHLTPVSKYVV